MSSTGRQPTNDRRGYRPWRPQTRTLVILDQAREVFEQYEAQRPLSIRQVFYRLVAVYGYPKTEAAYDSLCNYLDRARRARLIPFAWVRDDGIRGEDSGMVFEAEEGPEDWIRRYAEELRNDWRRYVIPRSTGQPRRVEVWCEAAGMHGQLQGIAARYGWPTFSGGGAESLTARHQLVARVIRQPELPTVVLHVGDHDMSGLDIFAALRDDVTAFVAEDAPDASVEFVRVAVRPDQVGPDTPGWPPKEHGNKGYRTRLVRWYADGYRETYQAEALPPDRLAEIVEASIRVHTDLAVLAAVEERERDAQTWLRAEFELRFPRTTERP